MNPAPPASWYYVYVLKSIKTNHYYFGCTSDLENRITEHKDGRVFTTKKMLPVELIYYEAYSEKAPAFKREKMLKQYGSACSDLKRRIGGAG